MVVTGDVADTGKLQRPMTTICDITNLADAPSPRCSCHYFSVFDAQAFIPFFPAQHFQRDLPELRELQKGDYARESSSY